MKTLISVIKDIPKDLRRSTSLFLVIILGIAAAFGTHLIAYGIVEDIAKEKRSYAVYNTISVVGAGSFDRNTYERITALPDVKNAFCFFPREMRIMLLSAGTERAPAIGSHSVKAAFSAAFPERKRRIHRRTSRSMIRTVKRP